MSRARNFWSFGIEGGTIAIEANLDRGSNGPRRRCLPSGLILIFLVLCGLTAQAWSQPDPSSPPADSALPDSPGAQLAPARQASPQPSSGSIHGVIVARDGAVYEGVHITLAQTGIPATPAREATSDNNGRFDFAGVPAGAFQLTFSSSGFATQVISGVLHPGESYGTQPVVLLLDTAVSQVQVTATQEEIALAEVHEEEKQRVFGVIPNFYVTYVPNAVPLTTGQKFGLAWKSSIDPVTFGIAGIFAGVEQATNDFSGYGQGTEGYAKRFGAAYADDFIGTMIGGAILPSLLKQDPRYFYKGIGTTRSRVLYAIAMSVVCKGDNGRWQPNYSGIVGSLAAGGISNLYYPAANRDGATLTFENALINTAGGAVQNIFQEFVVRKLTPRLPNYGSYGSSKP